MQNKGIQLKAEIENIKIGTINHSSIVLFVRGGRSSQKQNETQQQINTETDKTLAKAIKGKKENNEE